MADSRVINFWASSIVGDDLPCVDTSRSSPPQKVWRPPHKVLQHTYDQVISLPQFEGRYDPGAYLDWELEVEEIFDIHDFHEHNKVCTVTKGFSSFASVWWKNYCRENIYNTPTTWKGLKLVMRNKFVPSYYASDFLRKLQLLTQGNNTVEEYYDNLCTALFRCGLEECEEDFLNRFWRGLNHDIQDIIMHEELYSVHHLFRLACKAELKIRRRVYSKNKCGMEFPSKKVTSSPAPPTMTAPLEDHEASLPPVPTPYEPDLQGNSKGTNFLSPHEIDECLVELNTPCVEISAIAKDLLTPPVLDDYLTPLSLPCEQTMKIFNVLRAPIVESDSLIDLSAPTKLKATEIEPCHLIIKSGLDHIQLVKHDEVIARLSHASSLYSILMDPSMCLSHARTKIAEITCLRSPKSVYAPNLTFHLIGEDCIDNDFLKHRICITCDDLASLKEDINMPLLDHFDMTTNIGVDYMPNSMLHDCLFKHVVSCSLDTDRVYSPMLGWFNDEHYKLDDINMYLTYMCKLSCNTSCWYISCDNSLNFHLMTYANYSCIKTLIVQQWRDIKTDDLYIYHVYTLSLCFVNFQIIQSRGRLCFQEREDDVDMASTDTTKNIVHIYNNQVISINNYKNYYFVALNRNTTQSFILCRVNTYLYKPRVKIRSNKYVYKARQNMKVCVYIHMGVCYTHMHVSSHNMMQPSIS